jgi:hypothetical protein
MIELCDDTKPNYFRFVIPGRAEGASPESTLTVRGYGFRLSLRSAGMTAESLR